MLHAYLVTVAHPKLGDTQHEVLASEPMLAAEAAERMAAAKLAHNAMLTQFFAYKVEPAPMCRRGLELLARVYFVAEVDPAEAVGWYFNLGTGTDPDERGPFPTEDAARQAAVWEGQVE
jgi:hypothetical protein